MDQVTKLQIHKQVSRATVKLQALSKSTFEKIGELAIEQTAQGYKIDRLIIDQSKLRLGVNGLGIKVEVLTKGQAQLNSKVDRLNATMDKRFEKLDTPIEEIKQSLQRLEARGKHT